MSLPHKKSRSIAVGGRKYRWMVSSPGELIRGAITIAELRLEPLGEALAYWDLMVEPDPAKPLQAFEEFLSRRSSSNL